MSPLGMHRLAVAVFSIAVTAGEVGQLHADQNTAPTASVVESALRSGRAIVTIGSLNGDSTQIFGRLGQVAVDRLGGVILIDDQQRIVKAFDAKGQSLGPVGGRGGGPGEYRSPISLAVDSQNQVHVLEPRPQRISVMKRVGERYVFVRSISTGAFASNFCIMGGDYYLSTPGDSLVVRRIDENGKHIASFAPAVPARMHPGISQDMAGGVRSSSNQALIYCDSKTRTIVLIHRYTPDVRAFNADGRLLWERKLDDYHALRHVPVGDGRTMQVAGDPKTGTAHYAYSVVPLADGLLAITLDDAPVRLAPRRSRQVRLLSIQNGRELRRFDSPYILAGAIGQQVYAYNDEPFPHVVVVQQK